MFGKSSPFIDSFAFIAMSSDNESFAFVYDGNGVRLKRL